jgi:hypothetical protein
MDSQTTSSTETKQITIDVPAERLPEFYAFFSRFLAGGGPRRGRRGHQGHPGHHGHHGHHGRQCGPHRADVGETGEAQTTGADPAGTTSV